MQMDSRSSHPRILRGRASEVFLKNQPQGASLASLAKPPEADLSKKLRSCICIYVYMYICIYMCISEIGNSQ